MIRRTDPMIHDPMIQNSRIVLSPLNPDYAVIELKPDKAYRTVGVFKCVL